MAVSFRQILASLGEAPHGRVPGAQSYLALNIDKLRRDLDLEERGAERGARDEPPTASEAFDRVEADIIRHIEAARDDALRIFSANMETYSSRIHRQSIIGFTQQIQTALMDALPNFRARVQTGRTELENGHDRVRAADKSYEHFRLQNRLVRAPHYPESHILHSALILALLVLEGMLNGSMLSVGHEFGLVGGIVTALIIAFVNVVFLGLLIGRLGLRFLNHRKFVPKASGFLLVLLFVGMVVIFNLLVAHFRDALTGPSPERAEYIAIESFLAAPFAIQSANSWILCALGVAFALIAAVDGFKMDDPYPGYGAVARQRRQEQEDFLDTKRGLIEELQEERDNCTKVADEARRQLQNRLAERNAIIQAWHRQRADCRAHLRHIQDAANALLQIYHEADTAMRRTDPPARFSRAWQFENLDLPVFENPAADDPQVRESAQRTLDALTDAVAQVNAALDKALDEYDRIGGAGLPPIREAVGHGTA